MWTAPTCCAVQSGWNTTHITSVASLTISNSAAASFSWVCDFMIQCWVSWAWPGDALSTHYICTNHLLTQSKASKHIWSLQWLETEYEVFEGYKGEVRGVIKWYKQNFTLWKQLLLHSVISFSAPLALHFMSIYNQKICIDEASLLWGLWCNEFCLWWRSCAVRKKMYKEVKQNKEWKQADCDE